MDTTSSVAKDSSQSTETVEWITFGKLIVLLIPDLNQAHKCGWENWGGGNELPLSFNNYPSNPEVLDHLAGMARGKIIECRYPSKGVFGAPLEQRVVIEPRELPLAKEIAIAHQWEVPATDIDRTRACLVLIYARQGHYDAAAHWRRTEGRSTMDELARRMQQAGENYEECLNKLVRDAEAGKIPAYASRERARRVYGTKDADRSPRAFDDEIYPDHFDAWIRENEPHFMLTAVPPSVRNLDLQLRDLQQSYARLYKQTGKAPSKLKVHEDSGYSRDTVDKRWTELTGSSLP
jgi:hypothetical protein